jgi:hypothetical protein
MRPWNEDVAWQRLQDVQREAENRRLIASGGPADRQQPLRRASQRSLLRRAAYVMRDVVWILNRGAHPRWWSS